MTFWGKAREVDFIVEICSLALSVIQTRLICHMVFILKIWVCLQVMTYMLQGSFLNSSFYTVRAHPEHLLYEVDRAAALWVLVMNTNERVTETEHSCSLCWRERWREVTASVSSSLSIPLRVLKDKRGGQQVCDTQLRECLCKMWRPKQPEAY